MVNYKKQINQKNMEEEDKNNVNDIIKNENQQIEQQNI